MTASAGPGGQPRGALRRWTIAVGNVFFKRRNAVFPVLFVLAVVVGRPHVMFGRPALDRTLGVAGVVIALAGQAVRLLTIGYEYIERGGKEGKVYASHLVEGGVYAVVRNPMYVGNALIAAGIALVAGSPLILGVVLPFFLFVYHAIVAAEEAYLGRQFGPAYAQYCAQVPRWVPSLRSLGPALGGRRYDWRSAVRKELSTLTGLLTGLILLPVWRAWCLSGIEAALRAASPALVLESVVLAAFGLLVYLKQHRRFFYPA